MDGLSRLGKRLVMTFDGGWHLVIEPRMSGLVTLGAPPDEDSIRLRLRLDPGAKRRLPGAEILFWDRRGLGTVRLLDEPGFQSYLAERAVGPDALAVGIEGFRERMSGTRLPIKVALLDQRRIAGIGNLYASEILHRAGVHPARPSRELTRAEWARVYRAMRRVLTAAVVDEGSTLGDGTYRTALGEPGRFQSRHRVYGREGERCRACGRGVVRRIVQSQRSTFFCPRCQRKLRRAAAVRRAR